MKNVKLRFKYDNASTRLYNFDCEDSIVAGVKDKILGVNASLRASIDGGLSEFFVSDAGSNFVIIDGATIESSTSEPLTIAPNS